MIAVAVEDMVLAFLGGVDYFIAIRDFKEACRLIAAGDAGDGGCELSGPGVAVCATHHKFEFGGKPLLTDDIDRTIIADLSGGQGRDDTRAAGAESKDHLLAEIFGTDGVGSSKEWLIDSHRGRIRS